MGREIEKLASNAGIQVDLIIKSAKELEDNINEVASCDVAIEFTSPETALSNLQLLAQNGARVVSGTTGWLEEKEMLESMFLDNGGAFLYASNFSLGMNMMFLLNEKLAGFTNQYHAFNCSVEEIHHVEKKDSPSGTAISLAEGTIDQRSDLNSWSLLKDEKDCIRIHARREKDVKGIHTVKYQSKNEVISLSHEANSRVVFAEGALAAADFLKDKTGIFGMRDVLGL